MTKKGKSYWDRSVVCSILRNPAYKGQAAFGKTKVGAKLQRARPDRRSYEQPKKNSSTYRVDKEHWIYVPVPNIVDETLFDIVQEQLTENGKKARIRQKGATYLLQGLVVCQCCKYAYCGQKNNGGVRYYRCNGVDAFRFGGKKICNNRSVRSNELETAVWEEVKYLLKNPDRILGEYQRRLLEVKKSPLNQTSDLLTKQEDKLKRGISKLIDSYAEEHINKEEFEPRVKAVKQRLKKIEEQKKKTLDQKSLEQEFTLVVTNLEDFSSIIKSKLDNPDWLTKRDIIKTLVKRIEIDFKNINVVFRVKELPYPAKHKEGASQSLQHCCRSR